MRTINLRLEDDIYAAIEKKAAPAMLSPMYYIKTLIARDLSGIPSTATIPAVLPIALQLTTPGPGRPPKPLEPGTIDQTGAKFIVTPAKLRDLIACDAVRKDTRQTFYYWICTRYTSPVTGQKVIAETYANNQKLCTLAQFDDLAPAVQVLVTEKMKLYVQGKSREQIKAERDAVTF